MNPHGQLRQGLAKIALDTHRHIRGRDKQPMYYELAERDHQFQHTVKGTVGTVPIETTIKILFDIMFLYEYGYRRDSQLLEPQTHFGFTSVIAPPGSIPYAHVQSWIQDADLNYVGAHVVVGIHNPAIPIEGAGAVSNTTYRFTLHSSFHGYGVPLDPDEDAV